MPEVPVLAIDPLIDEESEWLINPRPSSKHFASLAERELAHDKLFNEGITANAAGDIDLACNKFREAYALLFRTSTLLSLVNMRLKVGEAELAYACYSKLLQAPGVVGSLAETMRVQSKLAEARQLHAEVRAIMEAPQAVKYAAATSRSKVTLMDSDSVCLDAIRPLP